MSSINSSKPIAEFKVSQKRYEWWSIEDLLITLNDLNYREELEWFILFINTFRSATKSFLLNSNMPTEVYDRFVKLSSDDYQQLFKSYIDKDTNLHFLVLKNKAFKAINHYIANVFFVGYVIKDIEEWIADMKNKYPLVSNSHFYKLNNKRFKDQCIQSIIDDVDEEISQAAEEVLNILKQQNPWTNMYATILETVLQTTLVACSREYLVTKFAEHWNTNANTMLSEIQKRKEQIERQKQTNLKQKETQTPQQNTQEDVVSTNAIAKPLTHQQETLLQELEQQIKNRVAIDIDYIKRMLRKWWPIYIDSLVQDMGEGYSDALLEEIVNLLGKFDVQIVTKKDEEIQEIVQETNKNHQKKKQNNKESNITSQTLESIKNTPEKLTTIILIQICKELWYRFWDEKEFAKYADKLWLDKEGKKRLTVKKKLIEYLLKPEQDSRITEWSRNTKKYEKLTFNDYSRMVKQKSTILWLTDHKTYEKLVDLHLKTNKTDFNQLMLTTRKEWDIDPRCV